MEGRVGFKHSESDCRTHDSDQFGFEGEEGGGGGDGYVVVP